MTIEPCGPGCVAEQPLLDTADGREHDECPDQTFYYSLTAEELRP